MLICIIRNRQSNWTIIFSSENQEQSFHESSAWLSQGLSEGSWPDRVLVAPESHFSAKGKHFHQIHLNTRYLNSLAWKTTSLGYNKKNYFSRSKNTKLNLIWISRHRMPILTPDFSRTTKMNYQLYNLYH